MTHIGFDYSSTAVYIGVIDGKKVVQSVCLKNADRNNVVHCMNFLNSLRAIMRGLYSFEPFPEVIIEEPWINGQVFPRSAVLLTRMATFIEIACLDTNYVPVYVHPLTWRKKVYGSGRPKGDIKKLAMGWVMSEYDFTPQDHNYAEAILIASYGIQEESSGSEELQVDNQKETRGRKPRNSNIQA